MADDRPADDVVTALARLQAKVDDMESTFAVRASRGTTGSVEAGLVVKAGTLELNGQTPLRADYPVLWQWAQTNGLVAAGLFTAGDGSTTFGVPDYRGYVLAGAGSLAVGATAGADTKTITTGNLPAHSHSHYHPFTTGTTGSHGGHTNGTATVNNGAGGAYNLPSFYDNNYGNHSHTGNTDTDATTAGSGTAFDVRQLTKGIRYLIWT